ncbi:hypothetical protein ACJX0J_012483, partial [Zea mays]
KFGPDVREGRRRQFNYIGSLLRDAQPELMDTLIQASKDGDERKLYTLLSEGKLLVEEEEEEEEDLPDGEEFTLEEINNGQIDTVIIMADVLIDLVLSRPTQIKVLKHFPNIKKIKRPYNTFDHFPMQILSKELPVLHFLHEFLMFLERVDSHWDERLSYFLIALWNIRLVKQLRNNILIMISMFLLHGSSNNSVFNAVGTIDLCFLAFLLSLL